MSREILTVAEMTAADAAAVAAGTPSLTLMERAGQAVTDAIVARTRACKVAVLCGPGNNGGDGYVIARLLKRRGWRVWVEASGPPTTADARANAQRWTGPTYRIGGGPPADLVVDALFGAGLTRPLEGEALAAARASHGHPQVIAVDIPSGIDGNTGQPRGDTAFRADLTVTFHRRKLGHVLQPGAAACGQIQVADIGLGLTPSQLIENTPDLWRRAMPFPTPATHKHSRGRAVVVGGDGLHTGAARLSARGALRIGAGLVTVLSPPAAGPIYAAALEAVMVRAFDSDADLAALAGAADAAVIGPAAGVTPATRANLFALTRTGAALVVDADALTVFRDRPDDLFDVLDKDDVLTPHPGEFERLFPGLLDAGPTRIEAARAASMRAGAVVLLKGPDTVIAAPDGRAAVNLNGTPWLATAGSGDVLAGFIAGLIAQGMDSFLAACAAAWIHADCAGRFGPGLIAEDLPDLAPARLGRLLARP
ncbi:NAD(P)H-hydrate dehydratase [Caulobacter sp. SLTY]|uniref:NAD(P)H-hydrate dehydratase n=1 Tax=Caulobacter sp. SLTY TaxID=2683262 RepID=UPI0014131F9B|nr:NAD(P)H-hydrate dehydratase [Caulobacter sp. SLTY]NBB16296.1 NAD(P)H-hydrate dehydratase [Caulobacter sp. SLTY]